MAIKIYLNGRWVPKEEAKISVFDHGLLYGDGVFEGVRSYKGLVFKLQEHIDRLFESARTLMLDIPLSKEKLIEATVQTLQHNHLKDSYIRIVVTRGPGDLGLDPRKCPRPTLFIIADKIKLYPKEYYQKGLVIATVATSRNVPEAVNPQIKSLNYLNNILAKIEAINAGVDEGLLLSWNGTVAECTGENIFLIKENRLMTPPTYVGILKGITRTVVMEMGSRLGLEVSEEVLTRHDLYNADEVFLTGTAAEIVPVSMIDRRRIGTGRPGERTRELIAEFGKLTKSEGVRYKV